MKKNLILLIVSFAMFMESIDTTILNTAIPMMAKSLRVNPVDLKIALISYLVSLAIFIPISGWIADKFGIKKVFIVALGIFTLSSIWCGFTHSLPALICARIIQGLGGSLTMPVGRLIVLRTSQRHELIAKMNLVVMVASFGLMLGPLLGGVITQHFSWRWIFWVNAPFGILAIILAIKLLPPMPARLVQPLDKIGFILFGSGLALLTFGLSLLSERGVNPLLTIVLIIFALVLLLIYALHSRGKMHPILKVELFKIRTFGIAVISNLITRLSFGGTPFLLPLMLQTSLHHSAQLAGLLLTPIALGILIVKPISVYVLRLFGYKRLLLLNTIMVSCILGIFCLINSSTPSFIIAMMTLLMGIFISMQFTAMNSLAYANISEEDASAATSIMSTTQQLAQSFGVAVSALLLTVYSPTHQLTVPLFHKTFMTLAVLTFLSASIFFLLKPNDGQELIRPPS